MKYWRHRHPKISRSFAATNLLVLALTSGVASATDKQELISYLNNLSEFSAEFEQERLDEDGERIELSAGDCKIKRPGQFLWNYTTPYEQLIVSDGQQLSVFDPDLEQVTQSPVGDYPANSPAALLGEQVDVAASYRIDELPRSNDGLQWYALQPIGEGGDFETIALGFDGEAIAAMRLTDKLSQMTILRFSAVNHSPELSDADFKFSPPPGIDVVNAPPPMH